MVCVDVWRKRHGEGGEALERQVLPDSEGADFDARGRACERCGWGLYAASATFPSCDSPGRCYDERTGVVWVARQAASLQKSGSDR